jgi:hypothetical protein
MQHTAPKQTKLLGAAVRGVGTITAVSAHPFSVYVLIEDEHGLEHHRFVSTLERHEVVFASQPLDFRTLTRHIGRGVWDEVLELRGRAWALELAA